MSKKVWLIAGLVLMLVVTVLAIGSGRSDDYQVIQQAVKKDKVERDSSLSFIRIEVVDKKNDKAVVKIRIPISLLDILSECDIDDINVGSSHKKLNWKRIVEEMKKSGSATFIEVDDEDEYVKIWIE